MKKYIKRLLILFTKMVAPIFYDKKYLCGKYFDDSNSGWIWVSRAIWNQRILGFNRTIPWMVSPFVTISSKKGIYFHPSSINNFQSKGCYFQNYKGGKIYICSNVFIAPNVGLITVNHDVNNLNNHTKAKNIVIGKNCWIGMNSILLPGVKLGNNTIVGAGSVVTKSFRHGNIVIAGNPAKVIKYLENK